MKEAGLFGDVRRLRRLEGGGRGSALSETMQRIVILWRPLEGKWKVFT